MTLRTQRIGVSAVFVIHGAVQGTFATRIPAIAEHLHLSPGVLGAALFAPSLGSLALMPFTGRLIHRFGGRRSTNVLLSLWCAALVLPAIAPSLLTLWLALFVFGASAGMADVAMNAQGVALDEAMGKSVMSSLHGMWSVGGFAAAGVGALAAHGNVGVEAHFIAVAIVLLVLAQFACRLLPASPSDVPDAIFAVTDEPKPPRFAFPTGAILVIALVAFCAVFAEVAGSDWAAVYLRRVLGAGHATAALGYTMFALTMAICRLTGDRVVRRFGPVGTVRASAIIGTLGAVLVVVAVNTVVTIVGFGLIGIGVAVVVPLGFAAAGRIAKAQTATGTGAAAASARTGNAIAGVATIAYGAGLAAPGVIGGIASLASLRISFIVVAALVATVAVFAGVIGGGTRNGASPTGDAAAAELEIAATAG